MNDDSNNQFLFPHERLEVYRLAVEAVRDLRRVRWPRGTAHLKDNAIRSVESTVLNIAEGVGRGPGKARLNHHRIAGGSAAEAAAVLDCLDLDGGPAIKQKLRRVGAMLNQMTRG